MKISIIIALVVLFSIHLGNADIKPNALIKETQQEEKYIKQLKRKIYKIKITQRLYMNRDTVKYMDSLLNIVDIYEGTHSYYLYDIDSIVKRGDILIIN